MPEGLIGMCVGMMLTMCIYCVGGIAGECAERNARIRRAVSRSRQNQLAKL